MHQNLGISYITIHDLRTAKKVLFIIGPRSPRLSPNRPQVGPATRVRVGAECRPTQFPGLDLHVNVRSFRKREIVCPRVLEFVYGIESECGWGCV